MSAWASPPHGTEPSLPDTHTTGAESGRLSLPTSSARHGNVESTAKRRPDRVVRHFAGRLSPVRRDGVMQDCDRGRGGLVVVDLGVGDLGVSLPACAPFPGQDLAWWRPARRVASTTCGKDRAASMTEGMDVRCSHRVDLLARALSQELVEDHAVAASRYDGTQVSRPIAHHLHGRNSAFIHGPVHGSRLRPSRGSRTTTTRRWLS